MVEGVVDGSPAVHRSAQALDHLPGHFRRHVLGFGEHQMLEEMGESGLAFLLPVAADVVEDADCHHGGVALLAEKDRQSVVQNDLFAAQTHFFILAPDR